MRCFTTVMFLAMTTLDHAEVAASDRKAGFKTAHGLMFLLALAAGVSSVARAEERAPYNETPGGGPLLAYVTTSERPIGDTLWSAPRHEQSLPAPNQFLSDETPLFNAFQLPRRPKRLESEALLLVHKRIPSRYAYDCWANLRTGYGSFLAEDTIGRSRTNGAGVQDPDFLYIKMSFKF